MKLLSALLICTALASCGTATSDGPNERDATNAVLVEHTCNAECKGDEHEYAHGEKGHECSPQCQYVREKRK